jgi:RecA-family ATPase
VSAPPAFSFPKVSKMSPNPSSERAALMRAGYIPTPCVGKRAILDEWTERHDVSDGDIEHWRVNYPNATNTGLLTFKNPTIDIDILDPEVVAKIEAIVHNFIGDDGTVFKRTGRAPKIAIPFRLSGEPFRKIATPIFLDTDGNPNKVECLADGQQFIAYGIHPDTRTPYTWEPCAIHLAAFDHLPQLSEGGALELIEQATEVLRATAGWKEKGADKPKPSISERATAAIVAPAGVSSREEAYGAAALSNAIEEVAGAAPGQRNDVLNAKAYTLGRQVAAGRLEREEVEKALLDAAHANGLVKDDGARAAQNTIESGIAAGMDKPAAPLGERDGFDADPPTTAESGPPHISDPPPLQWLDMSKWDREPVPERQWAIRDRVPLRQVGLFSGEGGTGKSIIELTKNVAHVAARDWLGSLPEPGPAFYLGAEDDADEIHIRLAAIAQHHGVTFAELIKGGLHVLCLLGQDATLCAVSRSGKVETTALYRQIYEAAGDIKPKNISVDTLSRAFAGNEIDRVQVYAFANHMQALAMVANGSVTILSHPSLQGMSSGSGISGSTAWHGAFRFRQYLTSAKPEPGEQPENDLRELQFKKNQYGPLGESIVLRYRNGLFLPEAGISGLDKIAREAKADEIFLALVKRFANEGRNVGDKTTAPNFAPTVFAKENEVKIAGLRKSDLEAAMRRLFADGKIHVENYGRPSRPASRIAIK